MITSTANRQIKRVMQLQKKGKIRREEDCFITEGIKMAMEAPAGHVLQIYVSSCFEGEKSIPEHLRGIPCEVVEDGVFEQMSDTKTPQGILCLMRQFHYKAEDLLKKKNPLLIVLEDLQDPGNVGTIFRTAEGAGADGIILSRNSVDIYNPKTIRATMGSIYRMPFLYADDLHEILGVLKKEGVCTNAAHLDGQNTYDREVYQEGTAFLIGNESTGLSESLANEAERKIRIPMEGKLESLNAAVAAALLMYEAHRQRRQF